MYINSTAWAVTYRWVFQIYITGSLLGVSTSDFIQKFQLYWERKKPAYWCIFIY